MYVARRPPSLHKETNRRTALYRDETVRATVDPIGVGVMTRAISRHNIKSTRGTNEVSHALAGMITLTSNEVIDNVGKVKSQELRINLPGVAPPRVQLEEGQCYLSKEVTQRELAPGDLEEDRRPNSRP